MKKKNSRNIIYYILYIQRNYFPESYFTPLALCNTWLRFSNSKTLISSILYRILTKFGKNIEQQSYTLSCNLLQPFAFRNPNVST